MWFIQQVLTICVHADFCKDLNDFEKGAYVTLSKGKCTEYANGAESCTYLQIFVFSSVKQVISIIHFKEWSNTTFSVWIFFTDQD